MACNKDILALGSMPFFGVSADAYVQLLQDLRQYAWLFEFFKIMLHVAILARAGASTIHLVIYCMCFGALLVGMQYDLLYSVMTYGSFIKHT